MGCSRGKSNFPDTVHIIEFSWPWAKPIILNINDLQKQITGMKFAV
jgi:hypothetical protein